MKAIMIGNGFIGGAHRAGYRALKEEGSDIVLAAICDIRPERLEENDGARTYTDIDEMLKNESDADFIDICVPTYLHAEISIKCMKAGFNVMCEKPMAMNDEECDRMIACKNETGKMLMIAHCCRFASEMEIIRRFIVEGSFGRPLSAFFTATGGRPDWGWENWFRDKNKSGGATLDLQAHNIDLMNWYFGVPHTVSAVAVERHDGEGYESVSANHVYGDGLYVHSWCDWGLETNKHLFRSIRVNFENGYIYNERGARSELVAVDNLGNVTDLKGTIPSRGSTQHNEIEYFANCIKTGQIPRMCKPEDSKTAVTVINAQMTSAGNNGAPVIIEEE